MKKEDFRIYVHFWNLSQFWLALLLPQLKKAFVIVQTVLYKVKNKMVSFEGQSFPSVFKKGIFCFLSFDTCPWVLHCAVPELEVAIVISSM
jgi:hypothetical protein